jgi:hypothetical protein
MSNLLVTFLLGLNSPLTVPQDDAKSNQQLMDDLATAMGMEHTRKGQVQAQIVYLDALGDDRRVVGVMWGGEEGGIVHGGRLGRDHTLTDVPNHFFRDEIMDHINRAEVEEDKKQAARTAVFSDLSSAEIAAYSAFIPTTRDEERRKEQEEDDRLDEIMNTHKPKPKSILEAKNILKQEALLDSIPDDLELTKRDIHRFSEYHGEFYIHRSAVKPGSQKLPYEEEIYFTYKKECEADFLNQIDLDCDQIRACIKRFTRGGIWTVNQFRLALGQIARPNLTKFLEKRGESDVGGVRVSVLCWAFFKTREVLGLDMLKSSEDDIKMVEEKSKKRKNHPSGDADGNSGKKTRLSTKEWLEVARSVAMTTNGGPSMDDLNPFPEEEAELNDLTDD